MRPTLPIFLLGIGGVLAWWSAKRAMGANPEGVTLPEGTNVEKIGSDVIFPDDAKSIQELRKLAEQAARFGGTISYASPEFQLLLDTPAQPVGTTAPIVSTTENQQTAALYHFPNGTYFLIPYYFNPTDRTLIARDPISGLYTYDYAGPDSALPVSNAEAKVTVIRPSTFACRFTTPFKLHPTSTELVAYDAKMGWTYNARFVITN